MTDKSLEDKSSDGNGLPSFMGFQPIIKDCPAESERKEMWFPSLKQTPAVGGISTSITYRCGFSGFYDCVNCLNSPCGGYRKPKT